MGKRSFFVTGTDTDAGKTVVTCGLLEAARLQGYETIGLKPVSAGCLPSENGLRNDDALALMNAMTARLTYEQVNPIAFEPPIAPHIAAKKEGRTVTVDRLVGYCRGALMNRAELALIEGAGGWRVPLNEREMLPELAKALNIPVILVVGVKLGCLNHACLTMESILRDGLKLAGWVANSVAPEMDCYEENISTLRALIPAPCLGEVPCLSKPDKETVASFLSVSELFQ